MTSKTEALLLEAITSCAVRHAGPYGPCYCREDGRPNTEQGHEERCKALMRAIKASVAVIATPPQPGEPHGK